MSTKSFAYNTYNKGPSLDPCGTSNCAMMHKPYTAEIKLYRAYASLLIIINYY